MTSAPAALPGAFAGRLAGGVSGVIRVLERIPHSLRGWRAQRRDVWGPIPRPRLHPAPHSEVRLVSLAISGP